MKRYVARAIRVMAERSERSPRRLRRWHATLTQRQRAVAAGRMKRSWLLLVAQRAAARALQAAAQ